jgi:hypothetical protein
MRERIHLPIPGRMFLTAALLALAALCAGPQVPGWQRAEAKKMLPRPRRFTFTIDPKTPLNDLLPLPPRALPQAAPLLADHLTQVPQVHFQEPLTVPAWPANYDKLSDMQKVAHAVAVSQAASKLLEQTAHQIAKINFLNRKQTDHFMHLLLERRPDLDGLPFAMGADCRLSKQRGEHFTEAVEGVRRSLAHKDADKRADGAWRAWHMYYPAGHASRERQEASNALLAALLQMLPAEPAAVREGLVPYLADREEDRETTRHLARLTLFDANAGIRQAARTALEKRPPADFTDILLQGLNYPWPEIARNAADAIAHLKRTDLAPKLVDLLDQPDPRAPLQQEIKGKQVPVVRELVRINHHRNCLLCHAPGNTPDVNSKVLTGAVPTPGESLSPGFYEMQSPDVVVRADVTYLRQDFSRLQKVEGAAPWPEMQRFDFLVRTRTLTEAEAKAYRADLARREPTSPYRRAALAALRSLTGRDAEPTAAAWRKVLATLP